LDVKLSEFDEPEAEVAIMIDEDAGGVTIVLVDVGAAGVRRRNPTPPRMIITARTIAAPAIFLLFRGGLCFV